MPAWKQDPILKQRASSLERKAEGSNSNAKAMPEQTAADTESLCAESDNAEHIPPVAENPWIKSERLMGRKMHVVQPKLGPISPLELILPEEQSDLPEDDQDFEIYRPGFVRALQRKFTSMSDLLDDREEAAHDWKIESLSEIQRSNSVEQLLFEGNCKMKHNSGTSESTKSEASVHVQPFLEHADLQETVPLDTDHASTQSQFTSNHLSEQEVGHNHTVENEHNDSLCSEMVNGTNELPKPNTVKSYRSLFENSKVSGSLKQKFWRKKQTHIGKDELHVGVENGEQEVITNGEHINSEFTDMVVNKVLPATDTAVQSQKSLEETVKLENQKNVQSNMSQRVWLFEKKHKEVHNNLAPVPRYVRAKEKGARVSKCYVHVQIFFF